MKSKKKVIFTKRALKGSGIAKAAIFTTNADLQNRCCVTLCYEFVVIPKFLLTGTDLYQNLLTYGFTVVESILGIWTFLLYVIGISEVQQFSVGKALLNLLLPFIVIVIPIFILVMAFVGFR